MNITVARAQTPPGLEPDASPAFGTATLAAGFAPDPFRVPRIAAETRVNVSGLSLGADCVGDVSAEPTFRLTAATAFPLLRVIFIADAVTNDSALIVRTPDGRYGCNDNANGLFNPALTLLNAPPGDYLIWVAGFGADVTVYGELFITQNESIQPGTTGLTIPVSTTAPLLALTPPAATPAPGKLSPLLPARSARALSARFLPDPAWSPAFGGGEISLPDGLPAEAAALPANDCGGYTSLAPSVRLTWSARSTRLRLIFVPAAPSQADAALIVRAPNGEWQCNRDFAAGFARPQVEFIEPIEGDYTIWIADEEQAGREIAGLLYVTETTATPETIRQIDTRTFAQLDGLTLDESARRVTLGAAVLEPTVITGVEAGGEIDIAALNPAISEANPNAGCEGFYAARPSLTFDLMAPAIVMGIYFIAANDGDDATLIARMPDGAWVCGDDSFGRLNPALNIVGNLSTGIVQVWVGSYTGGVIIPGRIEIVREQEPNAAGFTAQSAADETPLALDLGALPPEGAIALTPDAIREAYRAPVYGGGTIPAEAIASGCAGYIHTRADVVITWAGGGEGLRVFYQGEGDATLVIYTPAGEWVCADDSFDTLMPSVDLLSPAAGDYRVWVGSYDSGIGAAGEIVVTSDLALVPNGE